MTKLESKPLGVGLIGAGWMGSTLLQRLAERDDVTVRVLCSSDAQRGRQVADEAGATDARVVTDFDALLADDSIDAVFLVNPNAYHGPQSIAALEAGKHVFCEKPASTTFADHCRQIELAKQHSHLKTFVDYLMNFDTFEQRLQGMAARGDFGTITQAQVNYRHPVNIAGSKAWKLDAAVMGDAIGMGIIHSVSALLRIMESQAKPVSVYATSMPAQIRAFEADPIWNLQITFDNGAAGVVLGNIDSTNGYDAYHSVYGTKGALIFDSLLPRPQKVRTWREGVADGRWLYPLDESDCKAKVVEPWPSDTTTPDSGDVVEHQTGACVAHFVDCIREDRQSPLSFVNSATVAEVGWAAQASAKLKTPVELPLDEDMIRRTLA